MARKYKIPELKVEDLSTQLRIRVLLNATVIQLDKLEGTFFWRDELKNRTKSYLSFFEKQVIKMTRNMDKTQAEEMLSIVDEVNNLLEEFKIYDEDKAGQNTERISETSS
jgi:hypothetical protein